jgi:hypothetical protein
MPLARVMLVTGMVWLAGGAGAWSPPPRLAHVPPVVLWAWERPEDLRFIDVATTGVAWLDRTITLRGARIDVRLRRQPLHVATGTTLIGVVRIEADTDAGHEADPVRVAVAAAAAVRPRLSALQIDFDAVASQRELYRRILDEVRRRIPPDLPLSITALASWCTDDPWLGDLPVDEAVLMLFEMGVDRASILRRVEDGRPFGSPRCRGAIGVSTREPLRRLPSFDRAYVFNHRPWTPVDVAAAIQGVTP